MTNASIKNTVPVFSVLATAIALSLGAFAIVAHAQEDLGYYGASDNTGYYGASDLGYYGASGGDLGYYGASDSSGYYGASNSDLGYYGASDSSGYYGASGSDLGYYGASDNLGYYGTSGNDLGYYGTSDNLGYYGTSNGDLGYYGTSDNLGYYGTTDNVGYYGTSGGVTGTDVTGTDVTYENGIGYYYQDYGTSYGGGYSTGGGYSVPSFSFSAPRSYYSNPVVYQQQQQQQQQVIRPGNTTTTNNTCTNNSCNYSYVDNSISGSYNTNTTVTTVNPVRSGSTQYAVQYVYPYNYNYGYNYPTYNNVYCYISASQTSLASGQTTYLSWSAPGATSAYLSGVGSVSPNSSIAVTPFTTTTYTLTVSGYGGSNSCSVSVGVYSAINNTPSVSLTQIPYTGFDFGPLGNALYWLSLLSFAAAGAYLLVYYRGGMAVLASVAAARKAGSAPAKIVHVTAKKIEEVMEPVLAPMQHGKDAGPTTDSMTLVASKNNEAPRIIITRN